MTSLSDKLVTTKDFLDVRVTILLWKYLKSYKQQTSFAAEVAPAAASHYS